MTQTKKLTTWEWQSLLGKYNISDGHAKQGQNPLQKKIVHTLSQLYLTTEQESQSHVQEAFRKAFFTIAGQQYSTYLPAPLYFYSCSLAIEVVANYLRLQKKTVTLVHPTFDNLADILKRHNLNPTPIGEKQLLEVIDGKRGITTDALFVVLPNNPTSFELSKQQFLQLVSYCKKMKKILIIDFSFRFFSHEHLWDQYKMLSASSLDFITLEDTGKTWPTLDLKVGMILASNSIYAHLRDITDDLLLNVSPFIFKLLTAYINLEDSKDRKLFSQKLVERNRKVLEKNLAKTKLTTYNSHSLLSVAWIQLPKDWNATQFCKSIEKDAIFLLPGTPFYWHTPEMGERYLRIALARPRKMFTVASKKLRKGILKYARDVVPKNR